jgi:hypothetical protein
MAVAGMTQPMVLAMMIYFTVFRGDDAVYGHAGDDIIQAKTIYSVVWGPAASLAAVAQMS